MAQGTFRSAIKRKEFTITSDLAGVLDLDTKYTDLVFTSGQSQSIHTILRGEHLSNGQHITISNNMASNIYIDAALSTNNKVVDIEPGTTSILGIFNDKFLSLGGTSETKDVEELLISHVHGTGDISKVDPIQSLATTGGTIDQGLRIGNSGWEYYNTNTLNVNDVIASRMFS